MKICALLNMYLCFWAFYLLSVNTCCNRSLSFSLQFLNIKICQDAYSYTTHILPLPPKTPLVTTLTAFSRISTPRMCHHWNLNFHMIVFTSIPLSKQFLVHTLEGSFGVFWGKHSPTIFYTSFTKYKHWSNWSCKIASRAIQQTTASHLSFQLFRQALNYPATEHFSLWVKGHVKKNECSSRYWYF